MITAEEAGANADGGKRKGPDSAPDVEGAASKKKDRAPGSRKRKAEARKAEGRGSAAMQRPPNRRALDVNEPFPQFWDLRASPSVNGVTFAPRGMGYAPMYASTMGAREMPYRGHMTVATPTSVDGLLFQASLHAGLLAMSKFEGALMREMRRGMGWDEESRKSLDMAAGLVEDARERANLLRGLSSGKGAKTGSAGSKRRNGKGGGGAQGRQRRKDAMPKRPLSAYNIFFRELHNKLVKKQTEETKRSFEELGKYVGRGWKKLDGAAKAKYEQLANEDRERYRAEMVKFQSQMPVDIFGSYDGRALLPGKKEEGAEGDDGEGAAGGAGARGRHLLDLSLIASAGPADVIRMEARERFQAERAELADLLDKKDFDVPAFVQGVASRTAITINESNRLMDGLKASFCASRVLEKTLELCRSEGPEVEGPAGRKPDAPPR